MVRSHTTAIDVFENLQIKFVDANGSGTATINTKKCENTVQTSVNYSIYPDDELSNCDIITVVAKEKNSNLLSSGGYIIKSNKKEYTVKNLPIYPTSLTNINYNDCNTYFEKYITELVQQNSMSYFWKLDKKLTPDWYLLGNFNYKYIITPMESYFLYKSDSLQKNEYSSIYKVEMYKYIFKYASYKR